MLAAGSARAHGSNDGYKDDPARCYHWNSTVPNHAAPARGDAIIIWDKVELIGASVIEQIDTEDDVEFDHNACPQCDRSSIKRRKVKTPGWLCFDCHHEFDLPKVTKRLVRDYRTDHEAAWVDLHGALDAAALRPLCMGPRSQLSIRELDWSRFVERLRSVTELGSMTIIEHARKRIVGGFKAVTARARVGQAAFRSALIDRFGSTCAISGPQPRPALDAAHLYSYARHGVHDEHGGLLLRKDIHRLFDLGLICVHPDTLIVDVHEHLRAYSLYWAHHGQTIALECSKQARAWLQMHWTMHRVSSELAP
jgi:ribosomal protein L37AE/L43A